MRLIGNILWLLLGGLFLAIAYLLAGLIQIVLIITIPFGLQSFKLAGFTLWPFGRVMIPKRHASTGLSTIGNILWVLLAGVWLAIGHLIAAVLNAITIIGIPFAIAHLRLAGAALTPFGHEVVPISVAQQRDVEPRVAVQPLG
jgi:uncharacterized membrane protein YccF (DUF307 family)